MGIERLEGEALMAVVIDEHSVRELIKRQRQQIRRFAAEMEAVDAKLSQLESSPSEPDPIAIAELRSELEAIDVAAKVFIQQANERIRSLRELMRHDLHSS